MKKYLPLVITLLLILGTSAFAQEATPSPSPSPKPKPAMSKAQIQRALIATEKKLWEGWKTKDVKPFKAWVAADSVGVTDHGTETKADLLKSIAAGDCDVKSYELSDFKLTMLNSGTALLSYKSTTDGTCGGQPIPASWSSTTYVLRGGKWWAVTHQETAAR